VRDFVPLFLSLIAGGTWLCRSGRLIPTECYYISWGIYCIPTCDSLKNTVENVDLVLRIIARRSNFFFTSNFLGQRILRKNIASGNDKIKMLLIFKYWFHNKVPDLYNHNQWFGSRSARKARSLPVRIWSSTVGIIYKGLYYSQQEIIQWCFCFKFNNLLLLKA
jgi:hypothetical protein